VSGPGRGSPCEPRLGIGTGLPREARCLVVRSDAGARIVAAAGLGAGRAGAAAERLVAAGVSGLLSFGVAGGLAPGLAAGALVVGDEAAATAGTVLAGDAGWRARLLARLDDDGGAGRRVAAAGAVVGGVAGKAALHAATGAVAVDLETGPVARVAAAAGLPWLAVRVVLDAWDQALPAWLAAATAADGRVRGRATWSARATRKALRR